MKQLCFLLVLVFAGPHIANLQAQELVQKSSYKDAISEKYLVLKKDKSVKHGQYLRITNYILDKHYLMELGQYDNNKKSGTWITFFHRDPSNSMKSVGDYKNDKEEGMWSYFYGTIPTDTMASYLFGSEKRTHLIPPGKGELEYKVKINPENHLLESSGVYIDGQKAGDWEFYDFDGNTVHTYNYSSGKLVPLPTDKAPAVFLGGTHRFRYFTHQAMRDAPLNERITQYSEAVFELGENGSYRYVSGFGDAFLKDFAGLVLQSMPNEWVYTNETGAGKLHVICKAKQSEDGRTGAYFNMELKVVE